MCTVAGLLLQCHPGLCAGDKEAATLGHLNIWQDLSPHIRGGGIGLVLPNQPCSPGMYADLQIEAVAITQAPTDLSSVPLLHRQSVHLPNFTCQHLLSATLTNRLTQKHQLQPVEQGS